MKQLSSMHCHSAVQTEGFTPEGFVSSHDTDERALDVEPDRACVEAG